MGLKMVMSAGQSRLSPALFSATYPWGMFFELTLAQNPCLTRAHSSAFQCTKARSRTAEPLEGPMLSEMSAIGGKLSSK